MIKYSQLTEKPKQFLAATRLTVDEFEWILPVFRKRLAGLLPPELTKRGTLWQRRAGRALEGCKWDEMPKDMQVVRV